MSRQHCDYRSPLLDRHRLVGPQLLQSVVCDMRGLRLFSKCTGAYCSLRSLLRVCQFQCWSITASCLLIGYGSDVEAQYSYTGYVGNYGRVSDDIDTGQNAPLSALIVTDFDDLHTFNLFFDDISADASEGSGAIDALDVAWLGESPRDKRTDSSPYFLPQAASALRMRNWQKTGFAGGSLRPGTNDETADEQFDARFAMIENAVENRVGVVYGLGALSMDQQAQVTASGSILGTTYWAAGIQNQIVGPKGGVVWQKRLGRWTLDVQGLLMFGANAGDVTKTTAVGEELIPGALNRPLYARPTRVEHDDSSLSLSPVGELRAESCWRLSKSMSLHVNWSSIAVSNLSAASEQPNFTTISDSQYEVTKQDLLVHHLFCGVQYVR
jgi:hypothetical protein